MQATQPPWPHPSLEHVLPILPKLRVGGAPFAPSGAWSARWRLGTPVFRRNDTVLSFIGTLALERRGDARAFELQIDATTELSASRTRITGKLAASADELGSPQGYELVLADEDLAGRPLASDTLRGQRAPEDGRWTSDWSLFEALPRLAVGGSLAPFTLREELRLVKPGFRLDALEPVEVRVGPAQERLHGYRLVGTGLLPTYFWLDEARRPLVVASSLRAWVWEGV